MDIIMTPGITSKPDIRGGRPCIAGTGLRVTDIIISAQFGECSKPETAAEFEITLEQVEAAFAFYDQNRAYIDADIQLQFDTFDRLAKEGYGRPEASILPR